MTTCLNCQTKNRAGARFCRTCGEALPAEVEIEHQEEENPAGISGAVGSVQTAVFDEAHPDAFELGGGQTRPLDDIPEFGPRTAETLFDGRFLIERVVFSDEIEQRYIVTQVNLPIEQRLLACPDNTCGAISNPQRFGPAQFCTDCGAKLDGTEPSLLLVETLAPMSGSLEQVANKALSHSGVRAPLAAFNEMYADSNRYCVVSPYISRLQIRPDALLALEWGGGLARALDYLHTNGLSFNGRVDETRFGLVNNRAVWMDFTGCHSAVSLSSQERRKDIRALVTQLLRWLTVKPQHDYDPNLSPSINHLLEKALALPGFSSGAALAEAIERTLNDICALRIVYRSGWNTNVGMERDLNEDSLLTFEINRVQQFFNRSMGLYAVADGMGGHSSGEVASGAIIHKLAEDVTADLFKLQMHLCTDNERLAWLHNVIQSVNQAVYDLRKATDTDMGSTLVMAVLFGNIAYIANVGDSRAYLINSQGIRQITTDHSLVERLIATQMITREEARLHPHRNVVYRTIGSSPILEVDVFLQPLNKGDRLLLCSDGLSGMVADDLLAEMVLGSPSPQAACDALITAANEAGGKDNITAIVIETFSHVAKELDAICQEKQVSI